MLLQSHSWVYKQPEKTVSEKYTRTPMFTATLFTTAKAWKQPKSPFTGERTKKKKKKIADMYTREYYSAIKKNEIMPLAATQMDLEMIIQTKASQRKENPCVLFVKM